MTLYVANLFQSSLKLKKTIFFNMLVGVNNHDTICGMFTNNNKYLKRIEQSKKD